MADVGGGAEEVEGCGAEDVAALLADEEEDVGALLGMVDVALDGGWWGAWRDCDSQWKRSRLIA